MAAEHRGWRRPEQVRRVAVVGAGLIGSGWLAAFLGHGLAVELYDPSPDAAEKARAHVAQAWPAMIARGLARDAAPPAFSVHTDLGRAVAGVDFVQESTPERADLKRALFAELDRLAAPDVVVASSTSSLPISELVTELATANRFVLGHPFNPVHLMPLVELGGGEATDPAAIDAAQALYVAMGKHPVRLRREIFGHIANRLTSAMFREAVSLVASGTASVEDVDAAIRYGPALKWAIQGQFTTFHTSGGDGGLAAFLKHFSPGVIRRWESMTTPDLADPELQALLVRQMAEATADRPVAELAKAQDRALLALLQILDERSDE
ncbi:3-hydroxyacyl-CoA dehydrogenase NAD-binding domain-containing protein [Phenylobacterium sp. LjRoot225]|uniref:3-hydroxyacyl-CoA dehydrogenase NAD-binding domain-containing protein n=1 Tax=Phenylobacterium sp. LjRoot225 TaxID=3342285 RepID=UPI003ED03F01